MTSRQALSKLKNDKKYSDEVINAIEKDIDELTKLKDFKSWLGIDLITFMKAVEQETLFIKDGENIIEAEKDGDGWGSKCLKFEDGKLVIFTNFLRPNVIGKTSWLTPITLQLSDYGKVWALTREELQ